MDLLLFKKWVSLGIFGMSTALSVAQSTRIGIPDRGADFDPRTYFQAPPAGYGEVPFFWWQADTLTREKLTWQLDELAKKKISSLQINYSHTDDQKGLFWGSSFPSKPALFTEEWWDLFGWFMAEAKKRGMTVSLSDYTLGVGQGFSIDDARKELPEVAATCLYLDKKIVSGGKVTYDVAPDLVSLVACPMRSDSTLIGEKKINLTGAIQNNRLEWNAPAGDWALLAVYKKLQPNSYSPVHPLSGKMYVKHFFQPFEDRFPELSKGGLNFFFSDELNLNVQGFIWSDLMRDEFKKRKGYDLTPELAALFIDTGDLTPKLRMDYNDVMVTLSEEYFFKPVYDWHEDRGLIYGCDHGGRGRQVEEFGDYFRTQRWNQAPGCDQPRLGKDIVKNKVAASIAHMYERPRVWLEGFYNSGWGMTTGQLTDAIFANFVMGHNLLSLHGLYYSTPGGWWEWAPPCNHYRMPYWQEMDQLLECSERLGYLLSQGHHRADVAMLYPVEPVIAGYGNKSVNTSFELANLLYGNSLDFDFMDYESLDRATIENNELHVAGEKFKVLVIPSMEAIKQTSLEKALAFRKAGGTVICLGSRPQATDKWERNHPELLTLLNELFDGDKGIVLERGEQVLSFLNERFTRDFKVLSPSADPKNIAYVMHRKIGQKEYYALYNVAQNTECFFRAKGTVELWDPWTGNTSPLAVSAIEAEGVRIKTPLTETDIQIFVFDPAQEAKLQQGETPMPTNNVAVQGDWEFELLPSQYNKWGDYHWPGTDELLGAEIRFVDYSVDGGKTWQTEQVGYAPRFQLLDGLAGPLSEQALADAQNSWKDVSLSWRWGVKDDFGHQGYHGLKMEMYDDFIRTGIAKTTYTGVIHEKNPSGSHIYFRSFVHAPSSGVYEVECGKIAPAELLINGQKHPVSSRNVKLKKGPNTVVAYYPEQVNTYLVFRNPSAAGRFVGTAGAEKPLSMRWNGDMSLLPYDLSSDARESVTYRFESAPGLRSFTFCAYGSDISVQVANEKCNVEKLDEREDKLCKYKVVLKSEQAKPVSVQIRIGKAQKGFSLASAFPYPIQQQCGTGSISIGDWGFMAGLRCYSGGALYRKNIRISREMREKPVYLDLGDVVSTAHVFVNGKDAGIRMKAPWKFDLSSYLKEGDNQIEVKVYNTAANHYQTVPSQFKGSSKAGILGPVTLSY